jgi:hypothetical protein
MTPIREERMASMPPVFEITCHCEACGALTRVRQVVEIFN